MYAFGILGLVIGVYLMDCAFHGRPPIDTFKAILADPSNIELVLDEYTNRLAPEPYSG